MASAPLPQDLTFQQLERLGNQGRCDLVEGRIQPLSPTGDEHGRIELNLAAALRAFVRERRLGHVRVGEVGIVTRRQPDSVRGADVLYISRERYERRGRTTGFLDVAPELVAEILSPWDKPADLRLKLAEYFEAGVQVVWVVDPAARRVRVHRSATETLELREADTLDGGDLLPGFSLHVADLFAE
jgi:Uma2 family endonuclease